MGPSALRMEEVEPAYPRPGSDTSSGSLELFWEESSRSKREMRARRVVKRGRDP